MNISSGFPSSPSLYFQFFLGMECKRIQINKTIRSVWFRWQELMYLSEVERDYSGQTSASTSRVNLTSRRATRIRSKELFFEIRNEKKKNKKSFSASEKSTNGIISKGRILVTTFAATTFEIGRNVNFLFAKISNWGGTCRRWWRE